MAAGTDGPRLRLLAAAVLLALGPAVHAVGGGSGGATDAAGSQEAQQLLSRVTRAAAELNYDGVFVYRNGDWMESMRIIHRAADGNGPRSRLLSLSGEPREVIRDAGRVTCILPDEGAVRVSRSKPRGATGGSVFNPRGDFASHYSLDVSAGERVAGRTTRLLTVMPRDGYRYGYRLFVDEESGFLLKSALVGTDGRALEQIEYTSLDLPASIPDALLEPGVRGEDFTWYVTDAPASKPRESSWAPGWLPPGFRMRDRATDPAAFGRMPLEHLVYTDGLASVSVFIEHLDSTSESLEGTSRMGAVNAFGTMVDGFQVTVVGEVPEVTVTRVGRSMSRNSTPHNQSDGAAGAAESREP